MWAYDNGQQLHRAITEEKRMTNLQAFRIIRSFGMAVSYNDSEWRIDYRRDDTRKTPDSFYFTNDKTDAIGTARVMSEWKKS